MIIRFGGQSGSGVSAKGLVCKEGSIVALLKSMASTVLQAAKWVRKTKMLKRIDTFSGDGYTPYRLLLYQKHSSFD